MATKKKETLNGFSNEQLRTELLVRLDSKKNQLECNIDEANDGIEELDITIEQLENMVLEDC